MPNELGAGLILNSLNKDYDQFVQNFNMHGMGKTIAELHAMLKLYEKSILKKAEIPTVLREGASYFITFTDDFIRYGYVYLKHKHEVFETFKIFQNEVENQLGKKIKAIRSDQGSEYLRDLNEPPNYKVASLDPEFDKWLDAMNVEMQSMKDNQVWYLLNLPPYGQTVRNIRAIRILLAIAAFYDYEIWQMDVKTAFLNGHLNEDIYMVQPEGFMYLKHPNKVCKLQRSIYGLKQASRSWNKSFDEEIKKIGFTQNPDEPCVYLKASGSNVAFLILYVDDILLMGNNVTMPQEVKSWLYKCFSMKDLGEAAYILGIKIIRDRSKRLISLSQSAYLEKILKKFWMENSKKGYTSMIEKPDYRKSQGAKTPSEVKCMQRVPYASAIGSIIRFQQNPGEIHWTVVKAILKYLRNTKDMVLVYGAKPEAELKKSAKQSTTAMSSIEAEYIAAAEASMEAVWMRKFIDGLRTVMPLNKRPMEILCDNEPAIAIANDPGILKGARHFQRKIHYIREVIQNREIVLKKVYTDDNVADRFIKLMPFNKHYEHVMAIGIVPASSLM
ncbi:retrotransposon protein, putative, ty1-copia subclass [Tanacetum coccineum]